MGTTGIITTRTGIDDWAGSSRAAPGAALSGEIVDPPALNGKLAAWFFGLCPRKYKPIFDIVDFEDHDPEPTAGCSKRLDTVPGGISPALRRLVPGLVSGPDIVKEPVIEALKRIALDDRNASPSDLFYLIFGNIDSVTHSYSVQECAERSNSFACVLVMKRLQG